VLGPSAVLLLDVLAVLIFVVFVAAVLLPCEDAAFVNAGAIANMMFGWDVWLEFRLSVGFVCPTEPCSV
jgi:hypothetical protein